MKITLRLLGIMVYLFSLEGCSQAKSPESLAQNKPDFHRGMHIYNTFCAECHDTGENGAPELDDMDDWDTRSMQWSAILKEHVTNGFMNMPSKGAHPELSDQNISDALYYMEIKIKANEE